MSVFAQTLLRSSRFALSRGSATNPIQHALGAKAGLKYTLACRQYATAFQRDKPHVNIGMLLPNGHVALNLTLLGTIGHVDHGKVWKGWLDHQYLC